MMKLPKMNLDRKKVCIVLVIVFTIILLKYTLPYRVIITEYDNTYITVFDGLNGLDFKINNSDVVVMITQQINNLKLTNKRKADSSMNGYMYIINIFNDRNERLCQFTIVDNNNIRIDDYIYTANATSVINVLSDYIN